MNTLSWQAKLACVLIGVLFIIVLASSCSSQPWPSHDRWGYEIPIECRQNLNSIPVVVIYNQDLGYTPTRQKALGRWYSGDTPWGFIKVDKSLSGKLLEDVVAHEKCHALFFYMYGTPHWHRED